jgi:hypothetical protein
MQMQLKVAFEPSKNLIFLNLSSNWKLDRKSKLLDDENLFLALFIATLYFWLIVKFTLADLKGHAWEKVETSFVIKYAFYISMG